MRDHERIEELLAARALDGLERDDDELLARERAEHGLDCPECARLEREYAAVAERLALSLEPVPVRTGLEDEVLARASGHGLAQPMRSRSAWRGLGLAAAAVALLAGGWILRDLTQRQDTAGPPPSFLAQASIVRFDGTAEGTLAVAFRADGPGAYLLGTGLPAPAEDEVYELWLIDEEGRPVSGGCFAPEEGSIVRPVDGDVAAASLLAVTVESSDCPNAPTTEPILTADPTVI
jgi:anti-sigma-K factor RskA